MRWQRCLTHQLRNIPAKTPRGMQGEMKRLVHQVYQASTYDEGKWRAQALLARFRERYPSAVAYLAEDLEACLEHLRLPQVHRRRIRTTNLLERLFGEGKRRTKVIPRFPGEAACLRLVFTTLMKAAESWHGVKMTPELLRELDQPGLRRAKDYGQKRAFLGGAPTYATPALPPHPPFPTVSPQAAQHNPRGVRHLLPRSTSSTKPWAAPTSGGRG